jgi:lipopolysaccharide export LptBFGC system permease protein LptF
MLLLPLSQLLQIELLARITQSIAFVLGTFMAVTFTVFPNRRRQFFVRLVVYASWGLSLSLVSTSHCYTIAVYL